MSKTALKTGPKKAPAAKDAAPKRWGLWIGGRSLPAASGKTFEVRNPADGSLVALCAQGGRADVDAAVAAARKAFPAWAALSVAERSRLLFAFAAKVREAREELALLETANAGKPIRDSRDEADAVGDTLEYYAGAVRRHFGEVIPVSKSGFDLCFRDPIGVCGLIVPWNYPMVIGTWKLGPALACGNTVVLKPASYTPLTALRLAELASEAGLPDGVVNVVTGPGAEVGGALAAHPDVPKISFTGETKTGAQIQGLGAPHIKRVSLELGGKSPNLVFDDADLDACVEGSVASVFSNAGQDCCARSRALVHVKVLDRFVEGLLKRTRALKVGDPLLETTEVGPLISEGRRREVSSYVEIGKKEGAELLCGGTAPQGALAKGTYYQPTVLGGAKAAMRVFQEEIFGPVLCVTPFKTEDEAVELANATEYGLSGSIWTRDLGRALRMVRRVKSGNLGVNSASSVFLEAPFGGVKKSGLGRDLGMKALDGYCEVRNAFLSDR